MRFASELKVGLAIVASAVIFMLGYRYLQDVPLLRGTNSYYSVVDDAKGLISGNTVRMNGVKVGSVSNVEYRAAIDSVHIDYKISTSIPLPRGSSIDITGIDALGGVRLEIHRGPKENPAIPPDGRVRSNPNGSDLFADLASRAPGLADKTDSVLTGLNATMTSVSDMLDDPASDLRRTLSALSGTAYTLEQTMKGESDNLSRILTNLEQITGSVSDAVGGEEDSLAIAVADLRASIASLKNMMESLEGTTGRLDRVTAKIENGDGTLGLLINDPGLYVQLDSVARNLNELLADFRAHPRRYLRELKLVDLF